MRKSSEKALVHGDFSPKNILADGGDVVLLDCEVAHWGDPRFDLAFCLSHLSLKAMRRGADASTLRRSGRRVPRSLSGGRTRRHRRGARPACRRADPRAARRRFAGRLSRRPRHRRRQEGRFGDDRESLRRSGLPRSQHSGIRIRDAIQDSARWRRGKFSIPAAARRSRPTSSSRTVRSAAPARRPAPRPGAMRRTSCATATNPTSRGGACAAPLPASAARSPARLQVAMPLDQRGIDDDAPRARRHGQPEPARRECSSRDVARRRPRRGGASAKAAARISGHPRRRHEAVTPSADDEHPLRRRPCRRRHGFPGFSGGSGRREDFRRGDRHAGARARPRPPTSWRARAGRCSLPTRAASAPATAPPAKRSI